MRGHTSPREATMQFSQRITLTHFRRPVAIYKHCQLCTTADRKHCIFPIIMEYQSGAELDQHGLRYGPFPAEKAVHGDIMPSSRPCGSNQPSHQVPPPHHMTAFTPTMILMARRRLSGSPATPTAQTWPLKTIRKMGGFSPIIPLVSTQWPPPLQTVFAPLRCVYSRRVLTPPTQRGVDLWQNCSFSCLEVLTIVPASGALDDCPSSEGTQQHRKLTIQ